MKGRDHYEDNTCDRKILKWLLNMEATDWMIEVLGFNSQWGLGIFLFTTVSRLTLGPTHLPVQWVPGALSLGVKWPGREADHLHLALMSRMHGAIPPLPRYVFMA
jgi:hypothetical protein